MSAQLTWRALDEAGEARTAANRPAFLPQTLAFSDVEPVLDFFETVGVLLRRRAIDQELAWDSFSYWVLRYAVLAREQIQFRRKDESDETYYQEFEFLVKRLTQTEIDRRRLKIAAIFPNGVTREFS